MAQSSDAAEERPRPTEVQRFGAELIGTYFLTFVAAGADVIDFVSGGKIGHVARYLAPGFVVAAMIWSLSAISGAHINPAVTFVFVLRRCFPIARACAYVVAQLAGAIAAAATLAWIFGPAIAAGATHPGPGVTQTAAMGWEAIVTALLVLVILGTAEQPAVVGKNAALAVGITVAACGLFSSPMSGASMNPARSIGPQLLSGEFDTMWIYIVGPVLGAIIAAIIVEVLVGTPKHSERETALGKGQ
jgi:aquaporin Z